MSAAIKLLFQDLALFDWLLEKPGSRFFSKSSAGTTSFELYELSRKNKEGKRTPNCVYRRFERDDAILRRFGGKVGMTSAKAFQNGLLNSYSKNYNGPARFAAFVDSLTHDPFHWSDVVYLPTKTAGTWWENEGRLAFETERQRRQEERESVTRRIVIGCRASIRPSVPDNLKTAYDQYRRWMPNLDRKIVRPYALATVTKQTAARVYIDDVEKIKGCTGVDYSDVPIQGNAPNLYVDLSAIMVDRVSERGAARLIEMDQEYAADLARISGETLAQIIPIITQNDLRIAQKEAERQDMMKELIESLGKDVSEDNTDRHRKP